MNYSEGVVEYENYCLTNVNISVLKYTKFVYTLLQLHTMWNV